MIAEIKIGELAHSSRGSFKIGPFGSSLKKEDLSNEGIPVAGIENILANQFIPRFRRFISAKKFAELSDYKIEPDDILISTMGTIGRAAIAPSNIGTVIIDSHLFRMRLDTNRVFPPYLCYAINGYQGLKRQLKQMARGAIMDGLNTTILKECSIPLFAVEKQKRVAAILDKVDRLRRQRRFAQTLSDSFLQSVFIKMFDVDKYASLPLVKLTSKNKGSFVNGPFGSDLLTTELVSQGVPVIYVRDIKESGYKRVSTVCVTKQKAKELEICSVESADVLVAKIGDPPGIAAVYPKNQPKAIVTQDVIRIKPDLSIVAPEFLSAYLNSNRGKHVLRKIIIEGTRERFSLTQYKLLQVPVPPMPLQEKFADIVQKFERVRRQQREATRQAEHLFQTLLHRAFRGEL